MADQPVPPVQKEEIKENAQVVMAESLSPSEKQALAKERVAPGASSLPSIQKKTELGTDIGTADRSAVAEAVEEAAAKPVISSSTSASGGEVPGAYVEGSSKLPAWYKVGWTSFSDLPNPGDEKAMEGLSVLSTDKLVEMYAGSRTNDGRANDDLLAQFLKEAYYGEWYHNTAAMLFAVISTWLLTKLGGGLIACLVVGAFLATYYQTSIRRLRRNVRDDVQRELMATRLETDHESADWINHFMSRFWLIYEPVLSAQIIGIADAILVDSTPSFLDSIRMSTFTLGTKAPRVESVKTYPKTEPNVVCMDWSFSFTPNDILDMSRREIQSKINPKIVLTIRVGKGMLGAGMPILLEDLAFSGTMRLKFKLFNEFPHVKTLEASFLEKPQFDYSLKPVGGETFGFDINNIPGLQSFIQEQVHATLEPMMYAPNVYRLDVAAMMAGANDLESANGVLAVTVYSASKLKTTDLIGTVDPYVTLHLGNPRNAAELARTKALENNKNPTWDETHFILLNNFSGSLNFCVKDRNTGRDDSELGVAMEELIHVEENNGIQEGLTLDVKRNGKSVGDLKCGLRYFPVSKPDTKEDGTVIPPAESNSGVLRFAVHGCKDLGGDTQKKGSGFGLPLSLAADTDAYAIVNVNGQERLRTKTFKRSFNPSWNKFVEVFVADKTELDLEVRVMNKKQFSEDEELGRWSSKYSSLEAQTAKEQDWWSPLKNGMGTINLGAIWKPVVMTGFTGSLGQGAYSPPIGVVRVKFFGARDLKNVEAFAGGKSDPYVRIMSGSQLRGQTEHIDDNLDPDWNTALYVPVHRMREDLIFEVMDFNDIQSDKSLGLASFILKDIIKESTIDGNTIYEALAPVDREVELTSDGSAKAKGRLHYAASFHPTLTLAKAEKEEATFEEGIETKSTDPAAPSTPVPQPRGKHELPEKDLHGELIHYDEHKKINLSAYESGVLSVTVHSAIIKGSQKVTAGIYLDSNDPQYSTAEAKGPELMFDETGDAFVKERDLSTLIVRIDRDEKDDPVGYMTTSVSKIISDLQRYERESGSEKEEIKEFKLINCEEGTIRLGFRFVPVVQFKLDPSESLENQGDLTVTPIKASDLHAADKSGTSDPYVVFKLDGEQVGKTDSYKKDLNPKFKEDKERFTVPVPNRVGVTLTAEVYDWDQFGSHTLLGKCTIPFSSEDVPSFAAKEMRLPLERTKAPLNKGSLTVRLLWQPTLLARKRTGTLFSGATKIFTAPIHIGQSIMGGIGKKKSQTSIGAAASPGTPRPAEHANTVTSEAKSGHDVMLMVTVEEAKDLLAKDSGGTSDPYALIKMGGKELCKTKHIKKNLNPKWSESFNTQLNSTATLDITVKDHNLLGDVEIGKARLDLEKCLGSNQDYDGWVSLEPANTGMVRIVIKKVDADSENAGNRERSGGLKGMFSKK